MKARPLLFKDIMVQALLREIAQPGAGKTMTRRLVNRLRGFGPVTEFQQSTTRCYDWMFRDKRGLWNDIDTAMLLERCPYGKPGDLIWPKETFRHFEDGDLFYRADFPRGAIPVHGDDEPDCWKWQPSIFLPRWASRITLRLTDIRVEHRPEWHLCSTHRAGFDALLAAAIFQRELLEVSRQQPDIETFEDLMAFFRAPTSEGAHQ